MNRFLFFCLCVVIGTVQVGNSARYDSCELRMFKATAYYSPEEGQSFYVKWSVEDDKILNGNGTHGASWRAVFNGMIAAPGSYPFGTRIYIPGWGIGQVEDRWGAIVEAWERNEPFDRLDFWAGKWEVGLNAALRFGVRYFEAYVCPKNVWWADLWFSFSSIPLERKLPATLRDIDLSPWTLSSWTPILQRYLKMLGYMADVPESVHYGKQTTAAVCRYQQKVMGMNPASEWCGWFGVKTRTSLQYSLKEHATQKQIAQQKPQQEQEKKKQPQVASVSSESQKEQDIASRLFVKWGEFAWYLFWPLQPGDSWKEVRILQRKLQRLGHYPKEQEVTWVYDSQTIRAVYAFQLAQWLLLAEADPSVYGYLWPKTRAKINSV